MTRGEKSEGSEGKKKIQHHFTTMHTRMTSAFRPEAGSTTGRSLKPLHLSRFISFPEKIIEQHVVSLGGHIQRVHPVNQAHDSTPHAPWY